MDHVCATLYKSEMKTKCLNKYSPTKQDQVEKMSSSAYMLIETEDPNKQHELKPNRCQCEGTVMNKTG